MEETKNSRKKGIHFSFINLLKRNMKEEKSPCEQKLGRVAKGNYISTLLQC